MIQDIVGSLQSMLGKGIETDLWKKEVFFAIELAHSAAKWGLTWKSTFAETFPIFFGTKVVRNIIKDYLAPFFSKLTISKFRHLAILAILAIFGGYF